MKERPIIFNSEMVRAILEGRKTQTRRVIKPQPVCPKEEAYFDSYNKTEQWNWWTKEGKQFLSQIIKCPYGKVGDRLWVRETYYKDKNNIFVDSDGNDTSFIYKADDCWDDEKDEFNIKWKPSIFMPRWASRIMLEITNVKVERLQEISEFDTEWEETPNYSKVSSGVSVSDFKYLWNSIHKKEHRWEDNPWVWIIEFKRIKEQE